MALLTLTDGNSPCATIRYTVARHTWSASATSRTVKLKKLTAVPRFRAYPVLDVDLGETIARHEVPGLVIDDVVLAEGLRERQVLELLGIDDASEDHGHVEGLGVLDRVRRGRVALGLVVRLCERQRLVLVVLPDALLTVDRRTRRGEELRDVVTGALE
jgi:hypothetical protein